MNVEPEIGKKLILEDTTSSWMGKRVDRYKLVEGVMPTSFEVLHVVTRKIDTLVEDFGERDIGRVVRVDSGFWWIILLCAYTKSTGDLTLSKSYSCQNGMKLVLTLCLSEEFDTFPTLFFANGCCMIDRRMVRRNLPLYCQRGM